MTRGEFNQAAARLVALWPAHFAESTLAAYHEAVVAFTPAELEAGVREIVREGDRAPSIKALLDKLRSQRGRDQLRLEAPRPTWRGSEYGRLMLRLMKLYQQGKVPKEDFAKLTTSDGYKFDRNGHAQAVTVLELKNYLAAFEPAQATA